MKVKFILRCLLVASIWLLLSCQNEEPLGAPTITAFTPTSGNAEFSGIPATIITITGTNFGDDTAGASVQFNGTNASINSLTMTEIVATVPQGATTGKITVTIEGTSIVSSSDFSVIQNPTEGRLFPRKLRLAFYHADFTCERDTLWYDYTYNNGRIASIARKRKSWVVWPGRCDPCPVLLDNSIQLMEFSYLDRQILINVTENGSHSGSYTFDFDNDQLLYPYLFKEYDANGLITAEEDMTYEEGFLTRWVNQTSSSYDYPLSVESGNLLDGMQHIDDGIDYTQNPSPIIQFTGFDWFTYRRSWGGIDPVAIAFNWFRPSNNLLNRLHTGAHFHTIYSYEYANDQLTSISSLCNCLDHITWDAVIEY